MCATTMQPRPAIMSTGARDWYLKSSENPSIVFPIPRRRCPPFVAEPAGGWLRTPYGVEMTNMTAPGLVRSTQRAVADTWQVRPAATAEYRAQSTEY